MTPCAKGCESAGRRCKKCEQWKEAEAFRAVRGGFQRGPVARHAWCKACESIDAKVRYHRKKLSNS